MKKLFIILSIFASVNSFAQEEKDNKEEKKEPREKVEDTFGGTRIINSHSTESLEKRTLQFRISHRFGDMFGTNGGIQTMYGFDNAADIRLAFEYGLTDNIMIGIGRSKGMGPITSLMDGFAKIRLLQQTTDNHTPVSVSLLGTTSMTYMRKSTDSTAINSFPTTAHRLSYCSQLIITRKFGNFMSIAVMPTYVHRNYVMYDDQNDLLALGSAMSIHVTEKVSILGEYYYTFNNPGLRTDKKSSMGIGVEIKTYGHNFKINITNSRGFGETQFIPGTISDVLKGQFRLGFTITRNFLT